MAGNPVSSATSVTARLASRSAVGGAPARHEVPPEAAQLAGQLDHPALVVHGQQGPHQRRGSFRIVGSASTARMVAGYRRRSTALMRSWSDASSSSGRTGTDSWARIGPASTSSVATWIVQPGDLHAVRPSASRTACQPLNDGQEGRVRVQDAVGEARRGSPRRRRCRSRPSRRARSRHPRGPSRPRPCTPRGRSPSPKLVRSTSTASTPCAAATSSARDGRSTTTRDTGMPSSRMASRRVPLPDARTAMRTAATYQPGSRPPTRHPSRPERAALAFLTTPHPGPWRRTSWT